MQFIARFELTPTEETIEICRSMNISDLPPERIFEEWRKLILKSKKPSAGLNFLRILAGFVFSLSYLHLMGAYRNPSGIRKAMFGCIPFTAWMHSPEKGLGRLGRPVVGFAVLCHDLGKPLTTHIAEDGRIRSPMHEPRGEEPTRSFFK